MTMQKSEILTQDRLREILHYDSATGIFTWRIVTGNRRMKPGDVAGRFTVRGYRKIAFQGRQYLAHRLAWLYVYGQWPKLQLDHINCEPADNRIANLREATNAQNHANTKKPKTNKSGYKGVSWVAAHRKWRSAIVVRGKVIYLGEFDTPEEGHQAYCRAAVEASGEFARFA